MIFDIQPCAFSDIPDVVTVFQSAFASNPVFERLMVDVPADVKHGYDVRCYEKDFKEQHLRGSRYFKAVELSSGYAGLLI